MKKQIIGFGDTVIGIKGELMGVTGEVCGVPTHNGRPFSLMVLYDSYPFKKGDFLPFTLDEVNKLTDSHYPLKYTNPTLSPTTIILSLTSEV